LDEEPPPELSESFVTDSPQFHAAVLKAAGDYLKYSLVDQHPNWAPSLCAAPSDPPRVAISASEAADSHGQKLYYLFAKQQTAYEYASHGANPVGQVVVKESWTAEPTEEAAGFAQHASGWQVTPYATHQGKTFKPGEKGPLFVMLKLDPTTPETDQGWVYATLTPDGKEVQAAGRLQTCMGCHQEAKPDRLFGPQSPPPKPGG